MNCLQMFLKCSELLTTTDPTAEIESDELTEMLAEKCEDFLKGSKHKRRFEYIDKYTRNEIVMLDEEIPSPNVDRLLEVVIDGQLSNIKF